MYKTKEILKAIYGELLAGNTNTLKIRLDAAIAVMETLDGCFHDKVALAALTGVVSDAE